MERRIVIVALLASCLLAPSPALRADAPERLAVIVHASREVSLSIDDISQIFLRQRRYWREGRPIVPVNRPAESWERGAFTERVFEQEVRHLAMYWNRQYYQGVLPPMTLASDEAVRRFVALNPDAIAYLRASAVDDRVKVVRFLDPR